VQTAWEERATAAENKVTELEQEKVRRDKRYGYMQ
jgi:hypothetical protein